MSTLSRAFALAATLALTTTSAARAQQDPSQDGSFYTRTDSVPATVQGSSVTLEVILPTAASIERPVVLVLHGWLMPTSLYEGIARHLASRGFAAVLFEQPDFYSNDTQSWANNARDAISELARLNANSSCPFFGELDMSHVGVIGHSRGGAAATMLAGQDPRVKCAVALAPANMWTSDLYSREVSAASHITAPYLSIIGSSDDWLASTAVAEQLYAVATSSVEREDIEVAGGGHMMYFGGGADDVISSRFYTAWLERFLEGAPDPLGFTTGAAAAQELAQGILTVARHSGSAGGATASAPPAAAASPTLRVGSSGAGVVALQQKLHDLGFYGGAIDGLFGPKTQQAVVAFQASQGLVQDGIVGPATKAALGL
jgi:dienelactone hydrolase